MNLSRGRRKERKARAAEARKILKALIPSKMSKPDLAFALDVSLRTIYRWIEEKRIPGEEVMEKLRTLAKRRKIEWQG